MAATYRVVEFYSGIGGMYFALKSCGIDVKVVAAIDINTTANEVYKYNFPHTALLNRNIEGIKLDDFVKFNADIFTMSPPCQPFTRQGHQKASDDPRTNSFLHLMKMIRRLSKPPAYIFMENVKGFEVSETREEFVRTLDEANYIYQEFLLSPSQFGVPNSRLRYFLVAVCKPLQLPFQVNKKVMDCLPITSYSYTNKRQCSVLSTDNPRLHCPVCNKNATEQFSSTSDNTESLSLTEQENSKQKETECKVLAGEKASSNVNNISMKDNNISMKDNNISMKDNNSCCIPSSSCKEIDPTTESQSCLKHKTNINVEDGYQKWNIEHFLERDRENFQEYLLPENIVRKKVLLMDIVEKKCNHSCCFTKGYGHYIEGTGSVLQTKSVDSSSIFQQYNGASEDEKVNLLTPLGLRYFTPQEIANILCFPQQFDFPKTVTTKQKYRLLGNSLNVLVVTELMKIMFTSS